MRAAMLPYAECIVAATYERNKRNTVSYKTKYVQCLYMIHKCACLRRHGNFFASSIKCISSSITSFSRERNTCRIQSHQQQC